MTRLSRRALIALGSGSSLVIGGLAIWALSTSHNGGKAPEELYSTDRKPVAEGLNALPRDYAGVPPAPPPGVPQLGPPLPGDLGRPILSAGQQGTSPVAPAPGSAAAQRLRTAIDEGVDHPRRFRLAQIGPDRVQRGVVELVRPVGRGVEEQGQLLDLAREHGPVASARPRPGRAPRSRRA